MRYLAFIAVFMLAACSNTPDKAYYQLPINATKIQEQANTTGRNQIWVQRITLSDMLAANGIAYQTTDVSYTNASSHVWASPLDQQLAQALVVDLSTALPNRLVALQPLESQPDTLDITLTGFHGRYDGHVIIQGYWTFSHDSQIIRRSFDLVLEQTEDGYPALVRTLSTGWQQVANSIANEIQNSTRP
ncbi:membrane integrity-associated transporter subunit PqiC [Moellerella wisconsensis]|uniref:Putative lipoprotein n=1 Tax=Moellerella wisconsensis ATCC 35017 TaxID=1354267 RepID=A0A0N0Z8P1_9GAMM|nr:membrane integrity-associated transporter subunit PqiC [Moellerella wisconsensis]KPD01885.1 putative lipoprotein [Moellerella wisconsensis ATCC 35017]VFS54082.1 ABC-type uncharacterized transport system, auxiliary component [Moellerella wisconsensis]